MSPSTFEISLDGLLLPTLLGVPDEERATHQTIRASATFTLPVSPLIQADNLDGSVDYSLVAEAIRCEALRIPRKLIEKLAADIASRILADFPAISAVRLHLEKFILPSMQSVSLHWSLCRPTHS